MSAGDFGAIVGAMVPTFLISRIFLWITKRWKSMWQISLCHIASGLLSCLISALGHADGGPLDWSYSFIYLVAQFLWFVFDVIRFRRTFR